MIVGKLVLQCDKQFAYHIPSYEQPHVYFIIGTWVLIEHNQFLIIFLYAKNN